MKKKDPIEKRQFERFAFESKINFSIIKKGEDAPSSEKFQATGKNIGLGGICFSSDKELEPGTMLDMEIFLPQQPEPVHTKGEVRWCTASRQDGSNKTEFYTGVQFLTIGKDHVSLLVKYVCGNLCKDVLDHLDIADIK